MPSYFSPDYSAARRRFRESVSRAGGELTALPINDRGPGGLDLTIDVGWFGRERPDRAVVHLSGVHGVEAFAGSAIQLQWVERGMAGITPDCAAVLVHVVNPHGMAWCRRVNAHNVDLNRNCLSPGEAYTGAPDGYATLDAVINPAPDASDRDFYLRAARLALHPGVPALTRVIATGQYLNPDGLFFGGSSLEEEPRLLRQFIADRMAGLRHLVGIDVHTGLGRFAHDTLIAHDPAGSRAFAQLRAAFGTRVAPADPGGRTGYRARGTIDTIFRHALPDAQMRFVVQEFGTYSSFRIFRALRTENQRRRRHGLTRDETSERLLRHVFAPADERWRAAVLSRGKAVIDRAIEKALAVR